MKKPNFIKYKNFQGYNIEKGINKYNLELRESKKL